MANNAHWRGIIDHRLALAQNLISTGKIFEAENLYKLTLRQFEDSLGKNDPLIGMVALDLIELYEAQGKEREVKGLQEQIREIFIVHQPKANE